MIEKKSGAISFFAMAFLLFSLLGSEYLVFFLDRIIDGRDIAQVFSWPLHWYGIVAHWAITIVIWSVAIAFSYIWLKKRKQDAVVFDFSVKGKTLAFLGFVILLTILVEWWRAMATGSVFPQILGEYHGFQAMYGDMAWLVSIFQNIYYIFEVLMVMLMAACFQMAGEKWTGNGLIPWSSAGLALTWGAIHYISHPAGAWGIIVLAVLSGLVYVYSGREFYPTFAVLFLTFVL